MKIKNILCGALGMLSLLVACNNKQQGTTPETQGDITQTPDKMVLAECPKFQADSAMVYIQTQCDFGARVPGTEAWDLCQKWIAEQFKKSGLQVEVQSSDVVRWDAKKVPCRNIVARLNPKATNRILLCAHWDSRPWADNDANEANHQTPVLAANDGASGVAVMLELARQMQADKKLTLGVDFVCFDVEDSGTPRWIEAENITDDGWCLGSRNWAHQAARNGYRAKYGILLDMVGGKGATFYKEQVSLYFAEPIVTQLWNTAHASGYGKYFPLATGSAVTDDHVNVNEIARIPCVDIIPYQRNSNGESNFGPTWHTINDTPENIDPAVLEAVGQTVMQMIYNENTIK